MGKFDGLLICTDWDGTLRTANGLLDNDLEAIRYFQNNGGLFTVCSGRPSDFLAEYYDRVMPNTYTLALNGALMVSPRDFHILFEGFLDERAPIILEKMLATDVPCRLIVAVHYKDKSGVKRCNIDSFEDFKSRLAKYPLYKLVFMTEDEKGIEVLKRRFEGLDAGGYIAVSSWSTSLEILYEEHSKGAAIRRLKEHTASRLVIAVGDYENDIPMLRAADISYAVGGAPDRVKAAADRITVPAEEGAITHIIKELDATLSRSACK